MPSVRALVPLVLATALLPACESRNAGNFACGMTAVAGQSLMLEEFTRPGKTLGFVPPRLPPTLPVRIALGPALRAVAGLVDSAVVIGIEGTLPPSPPADWGVLVVHPDGSVRGVILYQGNPIEGAPRLGSVNAGDRNLPLVGLMTDVGNFQDASCPIFPDSLTR
jgi:hypothetical protein